MTPRIRSCVLSTISLLAFGCSGSNATSTGSGGAPIAGVGGMVAGGGVAAAGGIVGAGATSSSPLATGGASAVVGSTAAGGSASGGTVAAGGSVAVGGTKAAGGTSAAAGGTKAAGGTSAVAGGTSAKGGSPSVGGTSAKGGSSSVGGTSAKGGSSSVGGTSAKGGSSSVGGTSATGGSTGVCAGPKAGSTKTNPIFTDVFTADPAIMVDNCTFYIAAGHDQGINGFDLREWYLLKSTDLVNWTRTTPMTLKTFAWTNANAWAGQMIKGRNGKYYWYVPINDTSNDRMAIGVAVADSPEGPWKDALGKPIVNDALEMSTFGITNIDQTPHTIDPTVFIDDDGQAYLSYGGFWKMVTVKLNADMITLSGKLTMTTPPNYFESPYLIKRNGVYYEIYAAGSKNPTTIDYATSSSPMGPWTRKGTIVPILANVAGQDAATNHAGVAEFAGKWYIVYHISNGPNGGATYKRQVAIDKLEFNSDGSIKPIVPANPTNTVTF